MLQASGICVRRGGRRVLERMDLELPAGQVLGVLGANGVGKSTLLSLLAGELKPDAGHVAMNGRRLADWPTRDLAAVRAVLPQSPSLRFDLPVSTVISMGEYPHGRLTGPAEDRRILERVLALADVTHFYERRYQQLSGGERQRVQLARVLYQLLLARRGPQEYRVLLLDEPTASLDPRHQQQVLQAVQVLAHDEHIAAFVILHDVNLAASCCDQLCLLGQGRVVAVGTPSTALTPSNLYGVYQVEATIMTHPVHPERPLVVF